MVEAIHAARAMQRGIQRLRDPSGGHQTRYTIGAIVLLGTLGLPFIRPARLKPTKPGTRPQACLHGESVNWLAFPVSGLLSQSKHRGFLRGHWFGPEELVTRAQASATNEWL